MSKLTQPKTESTEDPRLVEIRSKFTGKITTMVVPLDMDEDEDDPNRKVATFYLKNPDRSTREMIAKLSAKSNDRAVIAGLKALRLGGDEVSIIESNYDAVLSAQEALIQHLSVHPTLIKKN